MLFKALLYFRRSDFSTARSKIFSGGSWGAAGAELGERFCSTALAIVGFEKVVGATGIEPVTSSV
jgi:hypothetical protein